MREGQRLLRVKPSNREGKRLLRVKLRIRGGQRLQNVKPKKCEKKNVCSKCDLRANV